MGNASHKSKKGKKNKIQCVVLGMAASGKSTFTRQLRVIHGIPFTPAELENFRKIIRSNILIGVHETVTLVPKHNFELLEKNKKYGRWIETLSKESNTELAWENEKLVPKLKSLWVDPAVVKTWDATHAKYSNLDYFFDKIDEIAKKDFTPTQEDIFRARQRTAGAASTEFETPKQSWVFKDAGGQLYERKLWPDIIQSGVHAVMFFVALDEYDIPSEENPEITKLEESIEAWKDLFKLPIIKDKCVLLFLNKHDIFTTKLQKDSASWEKKYPSCTGTSLDDRVKFVGNLYLEEIPEERRSTVFISQVTALDTTIVTTVFEKVRAHVVRQRLQGFGLVA